MLAVPGESEAEERSVHIEGSGWSKITGPTAQKRRNS